jgi:prophage maintenance system killer protein
MTVVKKKIITKDNGLIIYQGKSGDIELRGDLTNETVWATQAQIAEVFGVDIRTANEHLKNIYKTKELEEDSTIRKFRIVRDEGKRSVVREVMHYNLDAIISVGYRVNSKVATMFRQWATKTLRSHLIDGYTINRARVGQNYDAFMKAVANVQAVLPEHVVLDPKQVLELIKEFASTWMSLDAYDKNALKPIGKTKKAVKLTADELWTAIEELRTALMKKGEATELFAHERQKGGLAGIVGNVTQSFGGKHVYATTEEKAAHLLYFIVKNHPFSDGNKRSGAFAFVWFIRRAKVKGAHNVNPAALTALTLLVAESNPKDKELIVALITQLLK